MVTRRIALLLDVVLLAVLGVVVLAVLGVVAPAAATPASASASAAKLRLVEDLPLTLKGSAFKSAEQVTVTVRVNDRKLIRTAHTSAAGAFSVTFTGVRFDPCKSTLAVVARGRRTGIVRLAMPRRECAAP